MASWLITHSPIKNLDLLQVLLCISLSNALVMERSCLYGASYQDNLANMCVYTHVHRYYLLKGY